jgi:hypothetical protein
MVVWECELRDVQRLNKRLSGTLSRIENQL